MTYAPIKGQFHSDDTGNPLVATAVQSPCSAFGEMEVAELTPIIQTDFLYNINTDIFNTDTTNGTVTQADRMAVCQTSANTNSHAELTTRMLAKYRPGQGLMLRFTGVFTTGVANSTQIVGAGDTSDVDGVFFGYNGATFGILHRHESTDDWIAQANWNIDTMDGGDDDDNPSGMTLDPTKGNVFQVSMQYLGFGGIVFYVEDSATRRFQPVHIIKYSNTNTEPSFDNPSFPMMVRATNTTNNTNITTKSGSLAAFVEGKRVLLGPRNSISNTKTGVGTTQTNILTIRNKTTFASKTNRVPIFIQFFTTAADGNKPVEIQVTLNTTLGGTPSYSDVSTNTSVIDFDTAGTTISGGERLFTIQLGKTEGKDRNLVGAEVEIEPGDTLTFSGAAQSATSDISVACAWIEDF